MWQKLLIVLFLCKTFCAFSQDRIVQYKAISEEEIAKSFDSSLAGIIRCKEMRYIDAFDTETWSPNCKGIKSRQVNIKSISFTYCFFSKSIDDTFCFAISLVKQKNKKILAQGLTYIPNCIKKNENCQFITKDSAINIAIRDSILYPDNLTARFWKNYNKNNYYWIVTGRPSNAFENDKSKRSSTKFLTRSRKYINATNGQLVSWQDYNKPD